MVREDMQMNGVARKSRGEMEIGDPLLEQPKKYVVSIYPHYTPIGLLVSVLPIY